MIQLYDLAMRYSLYHPTEENMSIFNTYRSKPGQANGVSTDSGPKGYRRTDLSFSMNMIIFYFQK